MLRSGPLEERDDAADLLVGIDDLALLAGPHAADVDEVGAELDRLDEGRLGRLEVGVPVAAEEGVAGAVDDRHDRGRGGVETRAAQDERAGRRAARAEPAGSRISAVSGAGSEPGCLVTLSYLTASPKGQRRSRSMVAELLRLRCRHPLRPVPRSRPGRGLSAGPDRPAMTVDHRALDACVGQGSATRKLNTEMSYIVSFFAAMNRPSTSCRSVSTTPARRSRRGSACSDSACTLDSLARPAHENKRDSGSPEPLFSCPRPTAHVAEGVGFEPTMGLNP